MKRVGLLIASTISLFVFCISQTSFAQTDLNIWSEFVKALQKDTFTEDRIRPLYVSKEVLMKQLLDFKGYADNASSWQEWESPEIFQVKEQVHFIISLGFDNETKSDFCFSFIKEGDQWYYTHLENIFIRLDQTADPPTSEFPDVTEETKAFQRAEIYWSGQVKLFNLLAKEKGKEFAFDWFKDGAGYFVGAKTWVPFVEPQRAFILYLCWEQANLKGAEVVLEKLDDQEAIVRIGPQPILVYMRATHLKQQISFEDYVHLFKTIWMDRAEKAGWQLDIIEGGWPITFHFKSANPTQQKKDSVSEYQK